MKTAKTRAFTQPDPEKLYLIAHLAELAPNVSRCCEDPLLEDFYELTQRIISDLVEECRPRTLEDVRSLPKILHMEALPYMLDPKNWPSREYIWETLAKDPALTRTILDSPAIQTKSQAIAYIHAKCVELFGPADEQA
jgi:hypothetical protein